MKAAYGSVDEVEGFDTLNDADKAKIRTAWENEAVAPEDIPPTAVGMLHNPSSWRFVLNLVHCSWCRGRRGWS